MPQLYDDTPAAFEDDSLDAESFEDHETDEFEADLAGEDGSVASADEHDAWDEGGPEGPRQAADAWDEGGGDSWDEAEGADPLDAADEWDGEGDSDSADRWDTGAQVEGRRAGAMLDEMDRADAWDGDELDGDGFDDGDSELEDAFASAMDADSEDEFAARLTARLARLRRQSRPFLHRMGARIAPIVAELVRYLSRTGGGPERVDAMDALADLASDSGDEAADAFIPFIAGLAGRYVTRAVRAATRGRGVDRRSMRAVGSAAARAVGSAARALVRRHGPRSLGVMPHVVRRVSTLVARRQIAARRAPALIGRTAARVVGRPRVVAQLSRPVPRVRQVARAAVARVRQRSTAAGAPRSARPSARQPMARDVAPVSRRRQPVGRPRVL